MAPAALTCVREYSGAVHVIEPVAEPDRTSAARASSAPTSSSASGMSHRLLRACRFRPAGPYPKCRTLYGAPWRRRTQGAHGGAPDEHHPGAREVLDGRFDLHEGADGFLVVVIGVLVPTDAGGSVAPALRDDKDPSLQSAVDTRLRQTKGRDMNRVTTIRVTTRPCYQRHARRERSEWPPAGCNPGSPWTADSLRFGNRLRRTCGCGSIRRLSA